jgi:hypothetical protein
MKLLLSKLGTLAMTMLLLILYVFLLPQLPALATIAVLLGCAAGGGVMLMAPRPQAYRRVTIALTLGILAIVFLSFLHGDYSLLGQILSIFCLGGMLALVVVELDAHIFPRPAQPGKPE